MASESFAFKNDDDDLDRADLDGLENFFSDGPAELFSKGLSVKQAVFYFGETRRSIKSKLLSGEIPAVRLPEEFGRKWRVFPEGVPEQLIHLIPKKLRKVSESNSSAEALLDSQNFLEQVAAEKQVEEASYGEILVPKKRARKTRKAKRHVPVDYDEAASPSSEVLDFSPPSFIAAGETEALAYPAETSAGALEELRIAAEAPPAAEGVIAFAEETPLAQPEDKTVAEETTLVQPEAITAADNAVIAQFEAANPTLAQADVLAFEPEGTSEIATLEIKVPAAEYLEREAAIEILELKYLNQEERLQLLEKEFAELKHKNAYLETRVAGLEDQVKLLSQNICQNKEINKLVLIVPSIVLIASLLIFKLASIMPG